MSRPRRNSPFAATSSDPGFGARGIDRVQIYLNGEREDGTHLGDANIEGDGSWSLTFEPTDFNVAALEPLRVRPLEQHRQGDGRHPRLQHRRPRRVSPLG